MKKVCPWWSLCGWIVACGANWCAAQTDWKAPIAPFLQANCLDCHTGDAPEGGLNLEKLGAELNNAEVLRRWVRIHDRVASGEMPPKDAPAITPQARQQFATSLSSALTKADEQLRHTMLRRLNRVEYENTVRDLFDIRIDVQSMLPEDPTAYGFDNIGDVLALSPEQLEIYLQAADKALDQVFGADREPKRVNARLPLGRDPFASRSIGRLFVKTDDDSLVAFQGYWCPTVFQAGQATVDGTYHVKIHAKTYQTDKPLVMAVYGGDVIVGRGPKHLVGYFDVAAGKEWTVIEFDDFLEARGSYQMKPYQLQAPTQGDKRFEGPGLMIGEVEVVGPSEAWPPESRAKLLGNLDLKQATLADARPILTRLLPRAFRRPIEQEDVEHYLKLVQTEMAAGRPFLAALRVALQAILCSPEFLFREEPTTDAKKISQHALASRLSYFLWSSMPDDELLALAAAGRLERPEVLRQQVERMLKDKKSTRFVENFTGQWLNLRDINFTEPDMRQYPEFDEMLRYSMVEETQRFFREVLDHDLPLTQFVDSDWTILNERLAVHYGISDVAGQQFRRVKLPADCVRGGVLTQASVLKVTANGTNTSPVVRGLWVLENILGQHIPPPPSGVAAIEPDIRGATTVREQLDKHRNVASCASCHSKIDPPGFALESFDPIGGWRDWYRSLGEGEKVNLEIYRRKVQYRKGPSVDASGQLANGQQFADVRAFKKLVLAHPDQISRCLTEKLLTYATGREMGFSDRLEMNSIVDRVSKQQNGFRSLIHEVVLSNTFRAK